MSSQPLAGISWGPSAPRPRSSFATARGSVWWSADGPPPAAAPRPWEPSDPPARAPPPARGPAPRACRVRAPPAVLRPTITAVASMPTRSVDLIILRVSPGRFFGLLATLAIQALPTRPVWAPDYHPYAHPNRAGWDTGRHPSPVRSGPSG